MKKTTTLLAIVTGLLLTACGKHGFHESPACNRDFTVTASGTNNGFTDVGMAPYWFTVAGSGVLGSFEQRAVGSTVCLYVE